MYLYINCSQYCNFIRNVDIHVTWPLLYTNAKIIHIQIGNNLLKLFTKNLDVNNVDTKFERFKSQFYS